MYREIDILELLPQRPPFVMVDYLVDYNETQTTCELAIRPDNVFCENGELVAPGLIEHIAQTCAARLGYYNKYVLKTGVRLGFIGEVKDLDILRLPREGEQIGTTVTIVQEIYDVTLVSAQVRVGEEIIATTGLKIAQGEASPSLSCFPKGESGQSTSETFYSILSQQTEEGHPVFHVRIHPEWPIYAAHFPGNPITPGVCIVQMVQELLQTLLNRKLSLRKAKNVKYFAVISPEAVKELTVTFVKTEQQPDASLKVQAQVANGDTLCTKLSATFM